MLGTLLLESPFALSSRPFLQPLQAYLINAGSLSERTNYGVVPRRPDFYLDQNMHIVRQGITFSSHVFPCHFGIAWAWLTS